MSDETIFKEEIKLILASLPKICNANDLKKKYREETGHSINQKLLELGETNLYDFIRFKCKDICDIYRFDKEIKIERKADIEEHHDAELHKNRKPRHKNTNPKLNIPHGIIKESFRSNPQGFSKKMLKTNNKMTNPVKLSKTKIGDAKESETANEYAPNAKLSLADFVPIVESTQQTEEFSYHNNGFISAADMLRFPSLQSSQSHTIKNIRENRKHVQLESTLEEFPTLPKATAKIGDLFDEPSRETNECTPKHEASFSKNWNEVAKKSIFTTPSHHSSLSKLAKKGQSDGFVTSNKSSTFNDQSTIGKQKQISSNLPQISLVYENYACDDPMFLVNYPDVITDPTLRFSKPHLVTVKSHITLPIYITRYFSPSDFYYHYCQISLCRLMREMQFFYQFEAKNSNSLMISAKNLHIGLVVAVRRKNVWYRAVICDQVGQGNVNVILSDFACPIQVNLKDIRYLLEKFFLEPVKCVRGGLAVRPFNNIKWTSEAASMFSSMACGKSIQATLLFYNADEDKYSLEMVERLTSSMTISEALISVSAAQPVFVGKSPLYAILL